MSPDQMKNLSAVTKNIFTLVGCLRTVLFWDINIFHSQFVGINTKGFGFKNSLVLSEFALMKSFLKNYNSITFNCVLLCIIKVNPEI